MKGLIAGTAAALALAAPAQAHQPYPWNSQGHGPTIECSAKNPEAIYLTNSFWIHGIEGPASRLVCLRQINSSAWVVRSWHFISGPFGGVHDTTVDYDLHHNRYAAYDDRTWFSSRHVG